MRQDRFGRNVQLGCAAGAYRTVSIIDFEFYGKGSGCFVGDRGNVANFAVDIFTRRKYGFCSHANVHEARIEFGYVRGDDYCPVVDESCDWVSNLEEIAYLNGPGLQGAIERRSYLHVIQVKSGARQFRSGSFEKCDAFLQLCFRHIALDLQSGACFVFDFALPDGGFSLGKPGAAITFVKTNNDGIAIDVGAAFGANALYSPIRFGG